MDIKNYEKGIRELHTQFSLRPLKFLRIEKLGREKPDAIIVAGMGGSGIAGTLLQKIGISGIIGIPLISWKDYGIPLLPYARRPLYLFISFSGTTHEVLIGVSAALRVKGSRIAVVTVGGPLKTIAEKHRLPAAYFEKGLLAPRQATGLMLYGALGILRQMRPQIPAPDLSRRINPSHEETTGKAIARAIGNHTPLIYSSNELSHVGYFLKIHLNETAKTLAFQNIIPEANHNEVVSFAAHPKNITALFLHGKERSTVARAIAATTRTAKRYGISVISLSLKGSTPLERTLRGITIAEWISYYLARMKKVAPRQTIIIDEIKKLTK